MSDQYKCSVCGKVMTLDDTMRHDHHDVNNHYELLSEADTLRAENAKLREALEKAQVEACNSDYIFKPTWAGFIKIAGILQEALKNE